MQLHTPRKLTPITRSQSSRVLSAVGAIRAMTPALLNAASSRPNSATVRSTIAATWACAHIATDGECLVTGGDQLLRRRLHRVFLEVRQDDGHARLRERLRCRESHTRCGPGDERHFAAEVQRIGHDVRPSFSCSIRHASSEAMSMTKRYRTSFFTTRS